MPGGGAVLGDDGRPQTADGREGAKSAKRKGPAEAGPLLQQSYFANSGASPRSTFNLQCDLQNSTGGPVHRRSFPDSPPGVAQWVSNCSRYFRFRIDLDDRECVTMGGPAGDVQSFDLLALPMAMGDTLGVTKTGSVHLTWGSSWAPYEVRRCDSSSGPCTPTAITTTSDTSWDDPVLGDGVSYWYEVETLCTSY